MPDRLEKSVGKAIIVHRPTRRVLILRLNEAERKARTDDPSKPYDEWHIPGGSTEPEDGDSREAAAIREAKEETKLLVRSLGSLGLAEWDAFYDGTPAHFRAEFFACVPLADTPEPPAVSLDQESSDFAWASEDELPGYIPKGLTKEAQRFAVEGLRMALGETA